MNVLVLSDSHGAVHYLRRILETETECELVFFLGDGLSDIEKVNKVPRVSREDICLFQISM